MTFKGVTIKTPGKYTLDVYEVDSGADVSTTIDLNATDGGSTVTPQSTTQVADFVVTMPQTVIKNTPFNITVVAVDNKGLPVVNFSGTINIDLALEPER